MPQPTPEEQHVADWKASGRATEDIAAARADIAAARIALDQADELLDAIEAADHEPHSPHSAGAAYNYLEHRRDVRYNNAVAASTGHVLNEARISL